MRLSRRCAKDEAKKRLENIFSPEPYDYLTVVKVLDTLKEIQSSPTKRKKNVFQSAIKKIFEKRMYFPNYSLYQLMKIGHMFGGIIEYGFISNSEDLNEAYIFILNALKKSPESDMFCFGLMALDRIKHLLIEHREYCHEISTIPHLNVFPPDLLEYVNSVRYQQIIDVFQTPTASILDESLELQNSIDIYYSFTSDSTKPDVTFVAPKSIINNAIRSSEPIITNSVQAEKTLMEATESQYNEKTIIEPPKIVQRKLTFIFNNMSLENVKNKCAEVKDILKRRYLPWLSVFLTKRISKQPQFHSLYLTCLDCFNSVPLNELIELETVRNIKVMIMKKNSPQTKIVLKNMGHWLGLITLAKNKSVPFDLETMVMKAYANGDDELSYILPFVTKTLESCSKSNVFGPETPWTESVLNCLARLHQTPGLKLFFQLEIELLCKTLNVELKELLSYKLMKLKYYE